MKLKKLTPELAQGIIDAGFDIEPKPIQSQAIPKIKSGADVFIVAPENAGKSTAIAIGVIQQLKEAFEEAPRAIIIVPNKEDAEALETQFNSLGKHTNLRTFIAFDQGNITYQKDTIYEGLDVLICQPKRLNELINITGVPLIKVKTLVVDDANTILRSSHHATVYRLADNVDKAQIIISADQWTNKLEDLAERAMKNPVVVKA